MWDRERKTDREHSFAQMWRKVLDLFSFALKWYPCLQPVCLCPSFGHRLNIMNCSQSQIGKQWHFVKSLQSLLNIHSVPLFHRRESEQRAWCHLCPLCLSLPACRLLAVSTIFVATLITLKSSLHQFQQSMSKIVEWIAPMLIPHSTEATTATGDKKLLWCMISMNLNLSSFYHQKNS